MFRRISRIADRRNMETGIIFIPVPWTAVLTGSREKKPSACGETRSMNAFFTEA